MRRELREARQHNSLLELVVIPAAASWKVDLMFPLQADSSGYKQPAYEE